MINDLVTKIQSIHKKRGGLGQPGPDHFFQVRLREFSRKRVGNGCVNYYFKGSARVFPGVQSTLGLPPRLPCCRLQEHTGPEIGSEEELQGFSSAWPPPFPVKGDGLQCV